MPVGHGLVPAPLHLIGHGLRETEPVDGIKTGAHRLGDDKGDGNPRQAIGVVAACRNGHFYSPFAEKIGAGGKNKDSFPTPDDVWKESIGATGADFRTRTGDPILTMDVLYLLS